MTQSKNSNITKRINVSGLDELKNLYATLEKQCEQVSETIEKINSLQVTFSIDD